MTIFTAFNDALADRIAGAQASLVQVRDGRRGGGAGVVWGAGDMVITNAHVVRGRRPRLILPDGREIATRLLARDPQVDLAALALPVDGLAPLPIGRAYDLQAGSWVVAVGHPWGVVGAATAGAVIAVGPAPELPYRGNLIQVGLQLRPGHSGGALLDGAGRLVGINTMIAGPQVGLAIPVEQVVAFLQAAGIETAAPYAFA